MGEALRPADYKFFFLETVISLSSGLASAAKTGRVINSAGLNILR